MMNTLRIAARHILFLSPFILWTACSRPAGEPREALIRAANGDVHSVTCLQENGPDAVEDGSCVVDPSANSSGNVNGIRGIGGGSSQNTTTASSPNYVYWNILSFQEKRICLFLFGSWQVQACFSLFGYSSPGNTPPNDGWCDPWSFNPIYHFLFPRHCYQEPVPSGERLLVLRREPVAIPSNQRPESESIFIMSNGDLFSEYCPQAQTGPAIDPGPCQTTYHQRLNSETVRLINIHLDRAANTPLTSYTPEIQCLAVSNDRFVYNGRQGSVKLRNWESPCGTDRVNAHPSAGVLVRFLDRLWDYYGPVLPEYNPFN